MSFFIQRQFSGFLGTGSYTDPVRYPPSTRVWSEQDVYPSNILKIEDGLKISGRIIVATGTPAVVPLPQLYTSASKLFFAMRTNAFTKVVLVSPDHLTSTFLIKVGSTSDEIGIFTTVDAVTSITLTTTAAADTVDFFSFQMPDLTLAASWQNGYQTLGVISE